MAASRQLVVDVDANRVAEHSKKKRAAPTLKSCFGVHPFSAFVEHGTEGTYHRRRRQRRLGRQTPVEYETLNLAATAA